MILIAQWSHGPSRSPGAADIPSKLLPPSVATVMIVDNDHCGAFGFQHESTDVSEAAEEVRLKVRRLSWPIRLRLPW